MTPDEMREAIQQTQAHLVRETLRLAQPKPVWLERLYFWSGIAAGGLIGVAITLTLFR